MLCECGQPGLDGVLRTAREVALVGAAVEQVGAGGRVEPAGEAQRPGVLGGGLAVGPQRGGPLARGRGVPQHRVAVAGGLGVVGQPGGVGAGGVERRQGPAVQRDPAVRRQRLLDGHAGDLVAEADAVALADQDARGEAALELGHGLAGHGLEQRQLGTLGQDRDRVEQLAGARVEPGGPGQDRVAHRVGHERAARGEHLGDEERVAAGQPVQPPGVDVAARQRGHARLAQRGERDPVDGLARQLAEHDPQRMRPVELVVAVGREHQHAGGLDAPGQQADGVEGGLVGPVQVLEHQRRDPGAAQGAEQRRDHRARRAAGGHDVGELAAELVGDVEERAERARRVQRVAGPGDHPQRGVGGDERPHQDGLADPRLPGDEHDAPAGTGAHRGEVVVDGGGLRGALEELVRPGDGRIVNELGGYAQG